MSEIVKLRCAIKAFKVDGLRLRLVVLDGNYNNRNRRSLNVNANIRTDNRLRMALIHPRFHGHHMKTYNDLYTTLCSYENLELAWKNARKRKTLKNYVIEFEANLENNLNQLKHELEAFSYAPASLTTFIVRDPKTRRISSSHFRDRVVHHALCNIIGPILEKSFIYDSFANQNGKGTHKALLRAESFMRKVAVPRGGGKSGYALKADIYHYFDNVDHKVLLEIIGRKIKDQSVMWLIRTILKNHKTDVEGRGMPIGNLTSQFFANVYLNDLDKYIKHVLKAKYYVRYVDDFAIFHKGRRQLEAWYSAINEFLLKNLKLKLHPDKSRVIPLRNGITLLGFRVFHTHRLLKKSNAIRIWKRLEIYKQKYDYGSMTKEQAKKSLEGWVAYAKFANTYKLRIRVSARFSEIFKDA